jgi:HAD superfamily hydrolase (TIGR01509 family)
VTAAPQDGGGWGGRRVRAVLFDVGNTLAHLDCAYLAAVLRGLGAGVAEEGFARADALTRRDGWPPGPDFFAGYFGATARRLGLDAGTASALAAAAAGEHRRRPAGLWDRLDPEAVPTLAALRARGLRLGVVSNADGRVEAQLEGFGLRPFLDVVVDSAVAGVAKPDPRIFRLALAALRVPPGEALYVGDMARVDGLGARAAGMPAVLYDRWDVFAGAGFPRIRRLGEVLELA